MTINGNRPQQNNYRLDGISVNDQYGGSPASSLGQTIGVDAIEEFSVVSGNAPADYGKNAGAVVNAATRTGTNEIRGTAFEFLRNSAFDARNFFDLTTSPPPFKRNQFGGSVGAPIRHDKTFFFVDYEGLRQGLGQSNVISVPSEAARSGQLNNGTKVTVSSKVTPFLNFYPLPNGPVNLFRPKTSSPRAWITTSPIKTNCTECFCGITLKLPVRTHLMSYSLESYRSAAQRPWRRVIFSRRQ
jgi:hypothetical protein